MDSYKIVLIDDDKEIHELIKKSLSPLVEVVYFEKIDPALNYIESNRCSLVIIDFHFDPEDKRNALDILPKITQISSYKKTKYILITGNASTSDEIAFHKQGIDDLVRKPFNINVFRAIIEKHLSNVLNVQNSLKDNYIELDENILQIVFLNQHICQKKPVSLTSHEFKIFQKMFKRSEQMFTREQLWEVMGGNEKECLFSTVNMHISNIRKKLGSYSSLIETIRGEGYRYNSNNINL
ncbi:response regulator transcription factor [Bacteriovoracaceae bacterium]|nr:response regulator transcription factor [Bacteriovoracaceae bacterium]